MAPALSPFGQALGWTAGEAGDILRQQVDEETEATRKRRMNQAKAAGYSPSGVALSSMGILGLQAN